jgi:hypothetical protein
MLHPGIQARLARHVEADDGKFLPLHSCSSSVHSPLSLLGAILYANEEVAKEQDDTGCLPINGASSSWGGVNLV